MAERLAGFGSPCVAGTAEEFSGLIAADMARWREVAGRAGIAVEQGAGRVWPASRECSA